MNASNNAAFVLNNPSNPLVKVNLSTLQQLAQYGIKVNEFQKDLSALKVIAATRPLTEGEELAKEMWEYNLEHVLGVLQNRVEQFESMTLAEVA